MSSFERLRHLKFSIVNFWPSYSDRDAILNNTFI